LRNGEAPFCATVSPRGEGGEAERKQVQLSVLGRTREEADAALKGLIERARRDSVFRGAMIALQESEDRRESYAIKFLDLPEVRREEIVLPAKVMEVVERNVQGILAQRQVLFEAGVSTRHGVLFHGPPGTGKTLVTRYLTGAQKGYTAIFLTGRQAHLIRDSCQLARVMAPSMVVMEDVDLVASERSINPHNTLLHELMDEMDGLGEKTECIFLLTTNRPEILEPALASRPGRIDQAIYFPLPDPEGRRRLVEMYGKRVDLSAVALEKVVRRTEGASPAFLKELVGKAVLMAAERGEKAQPLRLVDEDFERAIRELIEFGGELTQQLLGFRRVGFRGPEEGKLDGGVRGG
jgi:ATP-dependent 26S proteasome regulatory subunit